MQVYNVELPYKHRQANPIKLYLVGDVHGGVLHCAEGEVYKVFKEISSDPLAYWVDMGDKVECITPTDPRWDSEIIAPWVKQDNIARCLQDWYGDMVGEAAGKCLGSLSGNHEETMRVKGHNNIQQNICDKLGWKNLWHSCLLKISLFRSTSQVNRRAIECHLTHGSGCAITLGGKINKLSRMMAQTDADIVATAHLHQLFTLPLPYLHLNQEMKLESRTRWGAITGSFLRTYTSNVPPGYGEKRNYDPVELGCVAFIINPETRAIMGVGRRGE